MLFVGHRQGPATWRIERVMDQQREKLRQAIQLVNGVVSTLDDPAWVETCEAAELIEDAWLNWSTTDRKVLRTWLRFAADKLAEAEKILAQGG